MEAIVTLRRYPRRRFVHVEHLLGASKDDRASSRVQEIRVLACQKQAIPLGRRPKELVPRKLTDAKC